MHNENPAKLVPPPLKKARTIQAVSSTTSSLPNAQEEEEERKLLFDTLPHEITENVFRFMSRLPYAANWGKYIPLQDIIAPLAAIRDLAPLASQFHTLCISKTVDCLVETTKYRWKNVPKEGVLWTDSIAVAHDFILHPAFARYFSFHTLIIADGVYDEAETASYVVTDFLSACPKVRSLSVVDKSGMWAYMFAAQLEKLEIVSSTNPAIAIPGHCPSLLELNFCIKKDSSDYSHSLSPFKNVDWAGVGSNLESLTITGRYSSIDQDELKNIRKYCNNLKRIDIFPRERMGKGYADFFASYGHQLEYVHLCGMAVSDLLKICESCKNTKFAALVVTHQIVPTLRVLGPRLQQLHYANGFEQIESDEWTAVWNTCPDLHALRAQMLKLDEIRCILSTPKPRLKEITITAVSDVSVIENILEIIAAGTSNLEVLFFRDVLTSLAGFHKLIDKNKPTLRSVTIVNKGKPCSQSEVHKLVGKLVQCPLLHNLSLKEHPARSILNTLQRHGIHFRRLVIPE